MICKSTEIHRLYKFTVTFFHKSLRTSSKNRAFWQQQKGRIPGIGEVNRIKTLQGFATDEEAHISFHGKNRRVNTFCSLKPFASQHNLALCTGAVVDHSHVPLWLSLYFSPTSCRANIDVVQGTVTRR